MSKAQHDLYIVLVAVAASLGVICVASFVQDPWTAFVGLMAIAACLTGGAVFIEARYWKQIPAHRKVEILRNTYKPEFETAVRNLGPDMARRLLEDVIWDKYMDEQIAEVSANLQRTQV